MLSSPLYTFYLQLGFLVVVEVVVVCVVVVVTKVVVVGFIVGPVGAVVVEFPLMSQNSPIHGYLHKQAIFPVVTYNHTENLVCYS